MVSSLEQSILRTLAYASVTKYPLTLVQLYNWLWHPPIGVDFSAYCAEVERLVDAQKIVRVHHRYMLPGDESLVEEHAVHYLESWSKLRRARRFVRLLSYAPFVRGFTIVNTLALDNTRKDSDIDIAVIVHSGRLWTARFFTIAPLKLLRVRPRKDATRDTICISFFVSDHDMCLESSANGPDDVFWRYRVSVYRPVWELRGSGTWQKFYEANAWLKKDLPFSQPVASDPHVEVHDRGLSRLLRGVQEWMLSGAVGDWCEKQIEKLQRRILPIQLRELEKAPGTSVVLNAQMLKFHSTDRRDEVQRAWQEKCRILSV